MKSSKFNSKPFRTIWTFKTMSISQITIFLDLIAGFGILVRLYLRWQFTYPILPTHFHILSTVTFYLFHFIYTISYFVYADIFLFHFTCTFSYIIYSDILPTPFYLCILHFYLLWHFTYSTLPTNVHRLPTQTFYLLQFTYVR